MADVDDDPDLKKMLPGAIMLISGRDVPIRMIAAWPITKRRQQELTQMEEWAKSAGVTVREVQLWWPVLMDNNICLRNGKVSQLAMAYVTSLSAAEVRRTERKPRPKGG